VALSDGTRRLFAFRAALGLHAGLGFVAPAILPDNLFNERPFRLYLIVAGFPVVSLL